MTLLSIVGHVQNYEWGTRGAASLVARLSRSARGEPAVGAAEDERRPFAELWLGTHPSGPARLAAPPHAPLDAQLPYLLKVLSVARPLSIQAHPDLELARRLHASRPDMYKDANHKPEMSVAVTDFELLCGFRPIAEVGEAVAAVPELAALLPGPHVSSRCELSHAFGALMRAEKPRVRAALEALAARGAVRADETLALRLAADYPGDVGALAAFFLNHVSLRPGQAVFLGAGEPHAYLSGDCVECMACSDNVVRAGLTPKPIDVETLVDMLTYKDGVPELLVPEVNKESVGVVQRTWFPPVSEFCMGELRLEPGATAVLPWAGQARVAVVIEGAGAVKEAGGAELSVKAGSSLYTCGETTVTATERMLVYLAAPNFRFTSASS